MSYTKGPWLLEATSEPPFDRPGRSGVIGYRLWTTDSRPRAVLDSRTRQSFVTSTAPDAYLISRAPEVFEALCALTDKLDKLGSDLPFIQEARKACALVEEMRKKLA